MKGISKNAGWTGQKAASTVKSRSWKRWLPLLFYPVGVVRIWRSKTPLWAKLLYSIAALPVFLLVSVYAGIVLFAAFLPTLDCSVADRTDKTIYNNEGNYSATFFETGKQTNNAYSWCR